MLRVMRHRTRAWLVLAGLTALTPLVALAQAGSLDCVRVEAVSRWGAAAFNHFVILRNECGHRARCQVATDVNPEAQLVDLDPGQTREVLTFRESPARVFTPRVHCERL
jgi:hypothetical protein